MWWDFRETGVGVLQEGATKIELGSVTRTMIQVDSTKNTAVSTVATSIDWQFFSFAFLLLSSNRMWCHVIGATFLHSKCAWRGRTLVRKHLEHWRFIVTSSFFFADCKSNTCHHLPFFLFNLSGETRRRSLSFTCKDQATACSSGAQMPAKIEFWLKRRNTGSFGHTARSPAYFFRRIWTTRNMQEVHVAFSTCCNLSVFDSFVERRRHDFVTSTDGSGCATPKEFRQPRISRAVCTQNV